LQAHYQSPASQRYCRSFVKELAMPSLKKLENNRIKTVSA